MTPGPAEPAKLLLERAIGHGQDTAFESWVRQVLASAGATGAVEGSSVLRTANEGFLLLRFASRPALDAWESSQAARTLLEGERSQHGAPSYVVRPGLETWFTLPGILPGRPPKWKMALVTWLALLPQVLVLGSVMPSSLPYPLGPALSTAIPVCALTWLIMPQLTKLLSAWLYRDQA